MRFTVWAPLAESSVTLVLEGHHATRWNAAEGGWWQIEQDAVSGFVVRLLHRRRRAAPRPAGAGTARRARREPRRSSISNRSPSRPFRGAVCTCPARSSTSCTSARSPPKGPSTPRSPGSTIWSSWASTSSRSCRSRRSPGATDGATTVSVSTPSTSRTAGHWPSVASWTPATQGVWASVSTWSTTTSAPSGNFLQEFGPYFTNRYGTPWGDALNLDDAGSDEVRRFVIDNADHVAAGLPRRRAAARRRPRPLRRPRGDAARGAVRRGRRVVDAARPSALADRGVGPQRPADGHRAGGRRSRSQRPVGRRRPPRAARAAHR